MRKSETSWKQPGNTSHWTGAESRRRGSDWCQQCRSCRSGRSLRHRPADTCHIARQISKYGTSHCSERVRCRKAAPEDRKSVVSGKSVSVRVDLGGRRIIKKKKKKTYH